MRPFLTRTNRHNWRQKSALNRDFVSEGDRNVELHEFDQLHSLSASARKRQDLAPIQIRALQQLRHY